MNGFSKLLLGALVVAYVVSPLDLMPGPIDDALIVLFSLASSRRLSG